VQDKSARQLGGGGGDLTEDEDEDEGPPLKKPLLPGLNFAAAED
jgi:hypothetical protein